MYFDGAAAIELIKAELRSIWRRIRTVVRAA